MGANKKALEITRRKNAIKLDIVPKESLFLYKNYGKSFKTRKKKVKKKPLEDHQTLRYARDLQKIA